MPRFFFNLRNTIDCDDPEGLVLSDAAEAREEAIRSARSIMADEVLHGRLPLGDAIEVADESGRTILTLSFREAVHIDG